MSLEPCGEGSHVLLSTHGNGIDLDSV